MVKNKLPSKNHKMNKQKHYLHTPTDERATTAAETAAKVAIVNQNVLLNWAFFY